MSDRLTIEWNPDAWNGGCWVIDPRRRLTAKQWDALKGKRIETKDSAAD